MDERIPCTPCAGEALSPDRSGSRMRRYFFGFAAACLVLFGCGGLLGIEGAVESGYSRTLYPHIQSGLAALSARVSFSVTELLFALVAGSLIAHGGWTLVHPDRLHAVRFLSSWSTISVVCAVVFVVGWGFNHHRTGIEPPEGTTDVDRPDLGRAAWIIAIHANRLATASGFEVGRLEGLLDSQLRAWYRARHEQEFAGSIRLKKPLLGFLHDLLGIQGYYSPFLAEVHANPRLLPAMRPFVMAHEKAHALGFASETQASWIAFRACWGTGDPACRYSAALEMLTTLMPSLARAQRRRLRRSLRPEVVEELARWSEWSRGRVGALARVSSWVNHVYLKMSGHSEGEGSYARVGSWLAGHLKTRGWQLADE